MVPADASGEGQAGESVPRKSGAAVKLTKVQRDACDVLAICASARTGPTYECIFTGDVAESRRIDDVAVVAFEAADRMDPYSTIEDTYALAECLIRTGGVK